MLLIYEIYKVHDMHKHTRTRTYTFHVQLIGVCVSRLFITLIPSSDVASIPSHAGPTHLNVSV